MEREWGDGRGKQYREQREKARTEDTQQDISDEIVAEKDKRTDKSGSEMNTEGGETSQTATQCQFRCKKGNMMNIYLTDSDEKAIADFVKDREELYDRTNEVGKDKARKDCLWERFTSSHNLSAKVCKTWFKSQRTPYGTLTKYLWFIYYGCNVIRWVEFPGNSVLVCPQHVCNTCQNNGSHNLWLLLHCA